MINNPKENMTVMKYRISILAMLLLAVGIALSGCAEDLEVYSCYNASSYTVIVTTEEGESVSIPSKSTKNIWLLGGVTVYDLYYIPANLVSASISGTTITFRDR